MSAVSIRQPASDAMPPVRPRFVTDADKWEAVCRRDSAADGVFFYSVRTTGVVCRPSCAARRAGRENVAFHYTVADAERAGFRPCKRCRPDLPPRRDREAELIAKACRMIENCEEPPKLADLASKAGISPYHFHRMFRRLAGVTPRAYAVQHRQDLVQNELRAGSDVTGAIYGAGFNSSGRFYEAAPAMLGMRPSAYRKGGEGEEIFSAVADCFLGKVLVAATARGVCAILLGDDREKMLDELRSRFPKAEWISPPPEFDASVGDVVRLVDDPRHAENLALPLDIRGTAFQRRVWAALRAIPVGETVSYAQIALRIGHPRAVRAVGSACGANALAVAIPCHRAVSSDGKLTGYRWGIDRKRRLLERERG